MALIQRMDAIGYLTKQEVNECLNDIKTFATFTIDKKETWNDLHHLMIIKIPNEYGMSGHGVKASLDSMFNSDPPYINALDAFERVAPEWFIDKYQKKNIIFTK